MACDKHLRDDRRVGHGVRHDRIAQLPSALLGFGMGSSQCADSDPQHKESVADDRHRSLNNQSRFLSPPVSRGFRLNLQTVAT